MIQGREEGQKECNCEARQRAFLCQFCNMIKCFLFFKPNQDYPCQKTLFLQIIDNLIFRESRYHRNIHLFFEYFVHCCPPATFAFSYRAFCPCSLFLACLDVSDEAERLAASQPATQAAVHFHLHYYSQEWAAAVWPRLPWCPLLWLFIYSASASVKAALRSASPIPALHIIAWSLSDRMSEPV